MTNISYTTRSRLNLSPYFLFPTLETDRSTSSASFCFLSCILHPIHANLPCLSFSSFTSQVPLKFPRLPSVATTISLSSGLLTSHRDLCFLIGSQVSTAAAFPVPPGHTCQSDFSKVKVWCPRFSAQNVLLMLNPISLDGHAKCFTKKSFEIWPLSSSRIFSPALLVVHSPTLHNLTNHYASNYARQLLSPSHRSSALIKGVLSHCIYLRSSVHSSGVS